MILRAAERVDPLGDGSMLRGALGAWNLPVRDVADERVREGVLGLALDGRTPLASDERLALERMEYRRGRLRLTPERAAPEDLADDRRILEELLLIRLEAVEPGRNDALERLGQRRSSADPRSR